MTEILTTPNPDTYKFTHEKFKLNNSYNFKQFKDTYISPMAKEIFLVKGVDSLFFGTTFISVKKEEESNWGNISPIIAKIIDSYLEKNDEIVINDVSVNSDLTDDDDLINEIKYTIDSKIKPAVQNDGGDIEFISYDDGIVYLQLLGSCVGCPSSSITLKMGIERTLKHYIPEVKEVKSI